MAIQGLRDTSNFVTDQRPKNWRESIMLLYPNGKAPLVALTSVMKSESTDDPEYNWWEKGLASQRFALTADITAVQTTIPLATGSASQLKEGHVLRVEQTSELMLVTADPVVDGLIPVLRGLGGTTATLVDFDGVGVNPNVMVIGTMHEENSDSPTGINYDPTKKFNFTQIFRNTLEMSRTASKTRLRTGDSVKEAKRECLEYHTIEMEKSFWLGVRTETTKNGKPARLTGGILSFIDAGNIADVEVDSAAGLSMTGLENYMERMFRFGSSEKMAFTGNIALLAIQRAIRKNTTYQIVTGEKSFGMNMSRLISPFGEIVMKTHPLFNQSVGGSTGGTAFFGLNSWFWVLDMENIKYRYLTDSDTKYQKTLQDNGLDGMQSGYLTECGMEVHHPTTHFLLKNLNEGIVDP